MLRYLLLVSALLNLMAGEELRPEFTQTLEDFKDIKLKLRKKKEPPLEWPSSCLSDADCAYHPIWGQLICAKGNGFLRNNDGWVLSAASACVMPTVC